MVSPTPRGKRGVSVDRAGSALANSARRNTRLSDVAEALERQGSTGSINYSRPMSGLGHSPTAAPKATKANGSWFTAPTGTLSEKPLARPATADGYRSQDARNVQAGIAAAANRPTKKKQIAQSTQGSHWAQANNTSLSSLDEPPADSVMVYDPASRTFVARARPAAAHQQPPSPTLATPAGPKPGEYDPSTRKIVPAIPPQQPSIVVNNAGQSPARKAKPAAVVVDTQTQPSLRSPARSDTSSSPVSPRAAGILSKQPSMVREDPEGEQEAETTTATRLNTKKTNGFSGFSKTTMRSAPTTPSSPIRTRNRSESLDVPYSGSESSGRARGNSYSPSRSARFSASPIVEFTRHDPPERGVSPAKSAMKHSPGSSLRGTSPMNLGATPASKAMSDTSDTPSVDGSGKKKKSVRVSFTDQAPNAGPPATPTFRAAAARKVSPLIDDDMEEIMKPRPDLPSFGSVRPSRVQQEVAEKVTERPPDRREPSSDRAIGGVLSHDAAKSKSASNPVPPEVTSKNGPSYSSDESDDDEVTTASELDAGGATAKALSSQVVGSVPPPLDLEKKESDVSDIKISLQPPTPGEEQTTFDEAIRSDSPPPRSSLEKFVVPGGWAPDADDNASRIAPATTENSQSKTKSAPDNAVATPVTQPEAVAGYAPPEIQLSDIAESDSDNSAVFSDAEEDLSYMDESGFASMDAIVESPVVKPKKDAGPESPSLRQAARRTSKEEPRAQPDDWSHATSYWKQLSKRQREQIERSHLSSDDEFAPTANSLANRPKKKSALKQSAPVQPATNTMPAQPTRSAMRKSMRGPPEPAPTTTTTNTVHMRSSLRVGGGGGMRTSMRDRPQSEYTASKPAERQNHRPTSSASNLPLAAAGGAMSRRPQSPDEISQDGPFPKMEQRQQQPQANARLAKKMPPPPPAPANDSDSESSFKKKRRPSQSTMDGSGRYAMKRSMRAGSFDDSQHQQRPISPLPPATRKAFSVRSLSPTGSFFGRKQLKESMRAPPQDSSARTLRGPNSMGGKTGKAQRKPPPAPRQTSSTSNMASKFKSKFADSDDSDDDDRSRGQKPSFFRSRFADSDDDEPSSRAVIPADLPPVRGIPRRRDQQDGDSTDLSDEDDDDPRKASRGRNKQSRPIVPDPSDVEKAMEAARRNLGMTNGSAAPGEPPVNEGSALSKGSLRKAGPERPLSPANEDSPKKRGFMGSILRRSRTYSNTSQKPPMASPPPPLPTNFTPASPRPGKLQRRTSTATQDRDYFNNNNPKTLPEEGDVNWPLSPPGRLGELRPSTSDGVSRHEQAVLLARQMRPDIGRSQSNSEGAIIPGGHVGFAEESNGMNGKPGAYGPKTGKKKKFGMLRRAFGLDD
jgi:serine/arginine repetitive matrix protein 2